MPILITGASRGIGLAIARRFAAQPRDSVRISVCSRHKEDLKDFPAEIAAISPDVPVLAEECNVSNEENVARFVDKAHEAFGSIDILVNNAGFGIFQKVEEMKVEEFDAVLATNLRGAFLVTQAVLPRMIRRRMGTIVTISSVAG